MSRIWLTRDAVSTSIAPPAPPGPTPRRQLSRRAPDHVRRPIAGDDPATRIISSARPARQAVPRGPIFSWLLGEGLWGVECILTVIGTGGP
eukprot:832210-Prorocentrum_minimum.AAC.1